MDSVVDSSFHDTTYRTRDSSTRSALATIGTPSSPRSVHSGLSSEILIPPVSSVASTVFSSDYILNNTNKKDSSKGSLKESIPEGASDRSSGSPLLREYAGVADRLALLSDSSCTVYADSRVVLPPIMISEEKVVLSSIEPVHCKRSLNKDASLSATATLKPDFSMSKNYQREGFGATNYVENLEELGEFQVNLKDEDFNFSCAHFVAYDGVREKLHGHNYTIRMGLGGRLNPDGYVWDFTDLKNVLKGICKNLTEYVILPMYSDVLTIKNDLESIYVQTQDKSKFVFPATDCLCLPIMHTTAEELAAYIWREIIEKLGIHHLQGRGIRWLRVGVSERPTQEAEYRRHLPIAPPP